MTKTIYSKEHREIAEKLKNTRKQLGLDQARVAKILKKTQSYISKIESGQRKIDILTLKEFAKLYEKKIDFFINKDGQ